MNTYPHNGAWLTEVPIDDRNTLSRPATDAEIAAAKNTPERKKPGPKPKTE